MHGKTDLCYRLQTPLKLKLGNTLVGWFTPLMTSGHFPLSSTPSNAHPIYDVTLLGLVPQSPSLVRARRSHGTVYGR